MNGLQSLGKGLDQMKDMYASEEEQAVKTKCGILYRLGGWCREDRWEKQVRAVEKHRQDHRMSGTERDITKKRPRPTTGMGLGGGGD